MLCVLILYISGGTYSLQSAPNDRFFEKLFMEICFTLRVFARNLLRGNRRRNPFRISFWCLTWGSNPGFSSNKPTHYLLDHGDFYIFKKQTQNCIVLNKVYFFGRKENIIRHRHLDSGLIHNVDCCTDKALLEIFFNFLFLGKKIFLQKIKLVFFTKLPSALCWHFN